MSPGRIVWSSVRRIGFPSRLEESPKRLGVRAVEILRSPFGKIALEVWEEVQSQIYS